MRRAIYIILSVFLSFQLTGQDTLVVGSVTDKEGPFNINLRIVDESNREGLIGVNVIVVNSQEGYISDERGQSRVKLNKGIHELVVSYIGYESKTIFFEVLSDDKVKLSLKQISNIIEGVTISSTAKDYNVKNTDIGKQVMSIDVIETLPPFVGEVDILKSITLLPGVNTAGEASSGFNVRGGSADQNLILLGGATLYNPSHLFGFFTAFNSNIVNNVSIYKGNIPANYGGRASSILDIKLKRGDPTQWGGKASVGLITGKVSAGGPIIKDKLTLLVAGRGSYSDWMLNSVKDSEISNSSAQFYDVNAVLDYAISDKSNLRYSFYRSADNFSFASDTAFVWSNQSHVLEYNQGIGDNMIFGVNASYVDYKFSIEDDFSFTAFDLTSDINDQTVNAFLRYDLAESNTITVGGQLKNLVINPGELSAANDDSAIEYKKVEDEQSSELSAYINHDWDIGEKFGIGYGLRFTTYSFLGPKSVAQYESFSSKSPQSIETLTNYGDGETIKTYNGLEPRIGMRYSFGKSFSFKAGFSRMSQYIHLVSNTTSIAPTDIWKLSDTHIKPQRVSQYSVGFFKNFNNDNIETSVEFYYKDLDNILDYKDGALLILSDNLEAELLQGEGEAYGAEFYVKKKNGPLTGWISYTYSNSKRRIFGAFPNEIINNGEWYPSNYDKPHNISTVAEYKFGDIVKFSAIFTYSTGRPVTYPAAKFNYEDQVLALYETRNTNRIPDYHRLDISFTFDIKSKVKILNGALVLAVYNLYGRKNAFSVFFDDVAGAPPQAYRLSVLGIPFPSLTYNFEF